MMHSKTRQVSSSKGIYYDFKRAHYSVINAFLGIVDYDSLLCDVSLNEMIILFYDMSTIRRFVPVKQNFASKKMVFSGTKKLNYYEKTSSQKIQIH